MKKYNLFNILIKCFLILIFIGCITAFIDYLELKSGKIPIFNIAKYDANSKIQVFRGIFHKTERKVLVSPNESFSDSEYINFKILLFDLEIKPIYNEKKPSFQIELKEVNNCQESSKLYYHDKNKKVYTFCLENINIIKDGKNNSLDNYLLTNKKFLEDLTNELTYSGNNQNIEIYFDNNYFSKYGLKLYKCQISNIDNYYITKKETEFQSDFCTAKTDS